MHRSLILGLCLLGVASPRAQAQTVVGEIHRVTTEQTASLRDAQHRNALRITVWYPAAAGSVESPLLIGPPGRPLFDAGATALNAAFADGPQRPVILLSHGFGGTARVMGWFGTAMARHGYVVIAVDHPGNNAIDEMTLPGAVLWWDRVWDLRSALDAIGQDPSIGLRLDLERVGAAGFSDGGFTALVSAGARVDPSRWIAFCRTNPDDGDCQPNQEFAATMEERAKAFARPELTAEVARAGADHAIPGLRAAFVMAPATVQALDPAGLAAMRVPVHIMLGEADTVAPPATSGLVAGAAIPNARVDLLPGVGHYDFLSTCTEAGRASAAPCAGAYAQAEAHRQAIAAAAAFFAEFLLDAK